MSKRRRLVPAGLTLVEFLFACSVMAIAALGAAGMFPSAFRSVVGGGQVTKATNLALEMVNILRNEPFDVLYQSPSSSNCFWGYASFDTRTALPTSCTAGTGSPESLNNKRKWRADLQADTAQATGSGLPGGYGTVAVTCMNVNASSPYTLATGTCSSASLLRASVTVYWTGSGPQSVNLTTYVARSE